VANDPKGRVPCACPWVTLEVRRAKLERAKVTLPFAPEGFFMALKANLKML